MRKLMVTFHNFANMPKKRQKVIFIPVHAMKEYSRRYSFNNSYLSTLLK
jgi:hypothetical protein